MGYWSSSRMPVPPLRTTDMPQQCPRLPSSFVHRAFTDWINGLHFCFAAFPLLSFLFSSQFGVGYQLSYRAYFFNLLTKIKCGECNMKRGSTHHFHECTNYMLFQKSHLNSCHIST